MIKSIKSSEYHTLFLALLFFFYRLEAIGKTPFVGIVSSCFEPHLKIYVESQVRVTGSVTAFTSTSPSVILGSPPLLRSVTL